MKRAKSATEKIDTRDRAEAVSREIAGAVVLRDSYTAEMERHIQDVRARYETRLLECALLIEQKLPALQAWAEASPELFKDKKSLDMVHATIGFRTGTPKCKPLRGWTWEKVRSYLLEYAIGYTRTTVEIDKEALISDREKLGRSGLADHGVQVTQDETFYVEPKREGVPQ